MGTAESGVSGVGEGISNSAAGGELSSETGDQTAEEGDDQASDEKSPLKIPSLAELLANAAAALKASTGKPTNDGGSPPDANSSGDSGLPPTP
jgi:hypothetical protein